MSHDRCGLCGRRAPLTRHHLIPRALHRKPRYRKRYGREQMQTRVLWICRPCHSHLHRMLSERELADHYASREALMSHPDIRAFVTWLADKSDGFVPKR
ncbi:MULTISPECIES: hypothetical protein [Salinicola]|uniref:hypothetical protein n=1 Tax=Salinicola TaxID=404432 RepID=UPI000DA23C35|nr:MULTISPECIES: hypothetical protein [Salinicola]